VAAVSQRIVIRRRDTPRPSPLASCRSVTVRAVFFDIGGVLERVGPPLWTETWRVRLELTRSDFDAAVSQVDPAGLAETGGFSEAEMRASYGQALGLSQTEGNELMADVWDWYCGELDEHLVAYVRGLRPRVRTGIVSNSADGARREETRRYAFPDLVDDILYSHEVGLAKPDPAIYMLACKRLAVKPAEAVLVDDVPANVDGAARVGLHAVLHESAAATISAVDALLEHR
jgi:epoxide hydrolase-like predicted phosphatase